jgi:hypothetical protein
MRTDKNDRGFRFALSSLFPSLRGGMSMLAVAMVLGFGGMSAQAAVVLGPDNFDTGANTHFTPNNDGSEWAVDTSTEVANGFYSRANASTAWSDAPSAATFGDVGVEANVRIKSWNASTQNRAFIFARYTGSSPSSATTYQLSIAPDSTITIERRGVNKAITVLATAHARDVVGAAWNQGTWTRVRLEVSGTSSVKLAAYVNGAQIMTATDSSGGVAATGSVGFGSAGASVDVDDVTASDAGSFLAPESGESASLSAPSDRPMYCALSSSTEAKEV